MARVKEEDDEGARLPSRPVPKVKSPTDALVKILKTTICGTDLHILKGDVPTCMPGRILGHEGVGIIEKTGSGVSTFHEGDHVLISCITAGRQRRRSRS